MWEGDDYLYEAGASDFYENTENVENRKPAVLEELRRQKEVANVIDESKQYIENFNLEMTVMGIKQILLIYKLSIPEKYLPFILLPFVFIVQSLFMFFELSENSE
ncbi:hypothetical protein GJ496_003913 [Pomphorhynchus laevis]|nr:hypothetical protein GJ496_003913 [Pomphorhynchus laevis]